MFPWTIHTSSADTSSGSNSRDEGVVCSQFGVGTPADSSAFTLPLEVAAVQQVAICGAHVPVEWRILGLQTREVHWSLVHEQLQPRATLAVVQDEEQVGSVGNDVAGAENSSCDRKD